MIANRGGFEIPANQPIIGKNVFCHASGIHQHGTVCDQQTYKCFDPLTFGVKRNQVL